MGKIIGIYKITSPTGRIYIGQSIDCERRKTNYKWGASKNQPRIHYSILKHGWDNHKFEIIHQCEEEELNDLESYYIELYQSFNMEYGLNLQSGGNTYKWSDESREKASESHKGKLHTEEEKKKMSESNKGRIFSEEHRKNISEAAKKRTGQKHSDETKKKISKSGKGKHHHKHSEEAKKKMSITRKGKNTWSRGRKLSEETKTKISESNKGKNTWSKGRVLSKETIQKMNEGRERNRLRKNKAA